VAAFEGGRVDACEVVDEARRTLMRARATNGVAGSLAGIALFSDCNRREMAKVARLGTRVKIETGATLTKQDEPGREFVLLIDGFAQCLVNGRPLAEYGPGAFFGEVSLLDGGLRTATILMVSAGELLVFEQREFLALLDSSPSITRKVLIEVARRQRAATRALATA
jgi:CRP-like cAMP-binding protein